MKKTEKIQSYLTRPIIFFDLETTGVEPLTDRIVQISAVKIHPDGTQEKKTRLINPTIPIPEEASEIHGIRAFDVENEPTFKQISKGLREFMRGCHFGGYNSNRFDIPLLAKEFERAGVQDPFTGSQFIDVFHLFCNFNRRRLEDAFMRYTNKVLSGNHDAEVDVLATIEIFESMLTEHREELPNKIEELSQVGIKFKPVDLFSKIVVDKTGKRVFNFGKYKGKTVAQINFIDPDYISWLLNESDLPANTKQKIKFLKNAPSPEEVPEEKKNH